MPVTEEDLQIIQKIIQPIIGKPMWGIVQMVGTYINAEFGTPIPSERRYIRGEWSLRIRSGAWRLQTANSVLTASNDPDEKMHPALQRLEGAIIVSIDILSPSMITTLSFEDGLIMRIFSVYTQKGFENWLLFTPDHHVLIVGPSSQWRYIRSDIAETE